MIDANALPTYYCSRCRFETGVLARVAERRLARSNYQKDKHEKHTVLSTAERLQSIFADPSASATRRDLAEALLHGPMEIDEKTRINFYATSTEITRHRYEWGTVVQSQDMTKVVLSTSATLRHAFPESSFRLGATTCAKCGQSIFKDSRATLTSTRGYGRFD